MKKVYFLCLLFCMGIMAKAQTTTTVYAYNMTPHAFVTGSALSTGPGAFSNSDGVIGITNTSANQQAGYAVFDLSSIPSTGIVSQVILGIDRYGFSTGIFGSCTTYGHSANFSAITIAGVAGISGSLTGPTLWTDCTTASYGGAALWTSGTTVTANGSYGVNVGDTTMIATTTPALDAATCTYIQSRLGSVVTISFSVAAGTSNVYNLGYETYDTFTTGLHAPYLAITWCDNPTGVTATASPTTICAGQNITLTGTATGASSYVWTGPSGVVATSLNATIVATSTGAYTLTANTLCSSFTRSVTASVTVNPSPSAIITTTTTVCQGNTVMVSDVTAGGGWFSSNTSVATISGGTVTGVNSGVSVISYLLGACPATTSVTVNDPPGPITGPTDVCASGGTITLVDGVTGGTWSAAPTTLATIDPVSGVVTGVLAGPATISYFTGACSTVTYTVTVDPLPMAIIGANVVCANGVLSLSDATTGGTWSSGNTAVATADPNLGIVSGVSAGVVTISYTLTTGCYVTKSVTVNPIPDVVAGPAGVCVGSTLTLSDGTLGGTWSSALSSTAAVGSLTGIVTGVTAGNVNISYTLPVTGCFIVDPFTVNPLPNNITGLNVVCVNAVITLSDATTGGTWSSQLTSVATADPATGDVTGVTSGVSHITYTLIATGCTNTFAVTVNPLPLNVITPGGPTTFCAGGSVTLNASVAGGDMYQWYADWNPVGTNSSTYVANTTDSINVTITDANGCIDTSAVTVVTLVQSAVIAAGGPVVFCQPGNVVLTVPQAPGILYQWTLNGANIPGANTNTYAATINGTYTCSLDVPGGCASITPSFVVTVHSMPDPIVVNVAGQLTTTNGYISYQWFLNTVAIPGATSTAVTVTVNGNYYVRVIDGNGCVGYSADFAVNNLGVQQINKTDINIYPNPATSTIHIESPVTVRATITDIAGKTLLELQDAKDIDISSFANGLYMIMLYDDNGVRLVVQKLVKE